MAHGEYALDVAVQRLDPVDVVAIDMAREGVEVAQSLLIQHLVDGIFFAHYSVVFDKYMKVYYPLRCIIRKFHYICIYITNSATTMNSTSKISTNEGVDAPHIFMKHRIYKILMVCCSYDGYVLEEDGRIESQINREYIDLNLSNAPTFTRVSSTREALELLAVDDSFDFILTMYNIGEPDVFAFAKIVKERYPHIPVSLMTSFSKDIYSRLEERDTTSLDSIFCWRGNADLIIGIIKLNEDMLNAEDDILNGGVQAILLVEDSIRFYSTYLPELYKLILNQTTEFLKDSYNEQQQVLRKRARPKILLATNYDEAIELYDKYKKNLLGVISDVGFPMHRGETISEERADAGIELCQIIKRDNPLMPVLLQSSQNDMEPIAREMGAGFISKNSKRLLSRLNSFIAREFAFGELVFTNPQSGEVIGHAKDLMQMQELIASIPTEAFEYHTSQNHLSKWLYARGLFPLAAAIRRRNSADFKSVEEHRASLVSLIKDYRTLLGQGVVAAFDKETYSDTVAFARMGSGSIGGKARGLAFMNSSLNQHRLYNKYKGVRITIPRTVVVATDYFDEFIAMNGLEYILSLDVSDEEILSEFLASTTPEKLRADLRAYIRTIDSPLAVRSSSKLEDSLYQPFAGIYSTYMIPYVENEDQMLRLLLTAVKSVYASVFFAASRSYIQSSQNIISEEKMAVIIQQVCGTQQDELFMPTLSGVARSINCYPIEDEAPEDGICNIGMGLGKLVVDGGRSLRFSPKYPKKVLQTSTAELALRDTQSEIFALDLRPEAFKTSTNDSINLRKLSLTEIAKLRNASYVCSTWDRENQRLSDSPFEKGRKVITFNSILKYDSFPLPAIIDEILRLGEEEMRCPVEVEFAVNLDVARVEPQQFNLLQIRPIIDNISKHKVDWEDIDKDGALVYAENALGVGWMNDIRDIIYIKDEGFSSLVTEDVARELLELNAHMKQLGRTYILIGMGRWGSSDPFLGVPAKWTHISEAKVIIERAIDGFDIEPSQGTHFFQNVTSLGVGYITLDARRGVDICDMARLDAMKAMSEGKHMRWVELESEAMVCVDGVMNRAIIKM